MPVHSSAMSMPSSFHGSFAGIALGRAPDGAVADADAVALDRDLAGEAAVHRIVAQQVRVGFHRRQIVDGDDFDIVAVGLDDGAQDIAADAAEAVDGNANRHISLPGLPLDTAPKAAAPSM